eukprot:5098990-Prymnesium_polylepis.7
MAHVLKKGFHFGPLSNSSLPQNEHSVWLVLNVLGYTSKPPVAPLGVAPAGSSGPPVPLGPPFASGSVLVSPLSPTRRGTKA